MGGNVSISIHTVDVVEDKLGRLTDMLTVAAVMKRELIRRRIGQDKLPKKSERSKFMGHKTLYETGSFYKRISYVVQDNVMLVGIVVGTDGDYIDIGRGLQTLFGWLDNYDDDVERITQAVRTWLFQT